MVFSTVVTLKNGLRVCNFSSPHDFTFDDGTVLPAVDAQTTKELMMDTKELSHPSPCGRWTDVLLDIQPSQAVLDHLKMIESGECGDVDIILVPFMVFDSLIRHNHEIGKCRVIRTADRITKVIHSDKFCC